MYSFDAVGTTWSVTERNISSGQATRSRQAFTSVHSCIIDAAARNGVRS